MPSQASKDIGDSTATTIDLGQDYWPLQNDGTLGTVVRQVQIRNYEGLILIPVSSSAKVVVTKSASATNVNMGDTVVYTLTLENTAPDAVINLTLNDSIPVGTTYVAGSATVNGWSVTDTTQDMDGYQFLNGVPTWNLVSLAPMGQAGSSANLTFSVKVTAVAQPTTL